MKKSWGLTTKIADGTKTIETRWYKTRANPWDNIYPDDMVYFKDSGDPVTVRAKVSQVEQYEDLTPKRVIELLSIFAKKDGLGIDSGSIKKFHYLFQDKRYCIVIFLAQATRVEPFDIDKSGFGLQTAWLTVSDIDQIRTDSSISAKANLDFIATVRQDRNRP